MSKFIRIRNKAECVDRRFLEKMGLSTKRDNPQTIGQFGSGAKLAPIYAIRKGIRWVNVGRDDRGDYQMEFVSQNVDGIDMVFYDYGFEQKESSFTVDAGLLSWDEDFQIFREAFANAVDVWLETGDIYQLDVVDTPDFEYYPGYFDVYISASPEMMEIVNNFDSYFSIHREPIATIVKDGGEEVYIYSASMDEQTRFFNKGVFVHCDSAVERGYTYRENLDGGRKKQSKYLYDWGFSTLPLNEERRLTQRYIVSTKIALALPYMTYPDHGMIMQEMLEIGSAEIDSISGYEITDGVFVNTGWAKAFYESFGNSAVPVDSQDVASSIIAENLRLSDHKPVFLSSFFVKLLHNAGVTSAQEIMGDSGRIKAIPCPPESRKLLDAAIATAGRYDIRICNYPIEIAETSEERILGMSVFDPNDSESASNKIFITTHGLNAGFETLVGTLIHELDHILTGAGDCEPRFRTAADDRIAKLLLTHNYNVDIDVLDGKVVMSWEMFASLGSMEFNIVPCAMHTSMMIVGKTRFMIDAELPVMSGHILDNGDETVRIDIPDLVAGTNVMRF